MPSSNASLEVNSTTSPSINGNGTSLGSQSIEGSLYPFVSSVSFEGSHSPECNTIISSSSLDYKGKLHVMKGWDMEVLKQNS